jgi:hypothetical protein
MIVYIRTLNQGQSNCIARQITPPFLNAVPASPSTTCAAHKRADRIAETSAFIFGGRAARTPRAGQRAWRPTPARPSGRAVAAAARRRLSVLYPAPITFRPKLPNCHRIGGSVLTPRIWRRRPPQGLPRTPAPRTGGSLVPRPAPTPVESRLFVEGGRVGEGALVLPQRRGMERAGGTAQFGIPVTVYIFRFRATSLYKASEVLRLSPKWQPQPGKVAAWPAQVLWAPYGYPPVSMLLGSQHKSYL